MIFLRLGENFTSCCTLQVSEAPLGKGRGPTIKENAVKSQVEDKSCEKSQGRSAFTVSSPPHVKYQDVQMEDALGCRFR
jgi:hypothetical protein